MPLKELAVDSPRVGHRIRQLLLEAQRRGKGPKTQLELAHSAGLSRQTLSNILSSDRITAGAAGLIARAFAVSLEHVVPELANGAGARVSESAAGPYAASLPALRSQRARVFLADLRAELTRAHATEEEIAAALDLVTAPEVFAYHVGGKPRDYSDDQTLQAMEAIAEGVIRPRIRAKKRR